MSRRAVGRGDTCERPAMPCPATAANKNAVEAVQYGVEGSTAFLECQPRSPQATVKWLLQKDNSDRRKEVGGRRSRGGRGLGPAAPRHGAEPPSSPSLQLRTEGGRVLRTEQGLLLRALQLSDGGLYSCTATENNFKHTVTRVQLRVLAARAVHAVLLQAEVPPAGLPGAPTPRYQDLLQLLSRPELGLLDQYCQGYWRPPAPGPPEPLAALKAKELQDQKKPRSRRNHPPETCGHT